MIISGDNNAPNAIVFIKDNYFEENSTSLSKYRYLNSISSSVTNEFKTRTSFKISRSILTSYSGFNTVMITVKNLKSRVRLLLLTHSKTIDCYEKINILVSFTELKLAC